MTFLPSFLENHAFLAIGIIVVIYILWVLFPVRSSLRKFSKKELDSHMKGDEAALIYLDGEIDRLMIILKKEYSNLSSKMFIKKSPEIKEFWGELIELLIEMDLIKNKYRSFAHAKLKTRAFVLAYASLVRQYKTGLMVLDWVGNSDSLRKLLDQNNEFSTIKLRLTETSELLRLNAGRLYFKIIQKDLAHPELNKIIKDGLVVVNKSIKKLPKLAAKNPLHILKKSSFKLWFPIQKNVARGLSYIRVRRRDYLIQPKHLTPHIDKLQPGDIFLERREWHATNVGIPGYWTHAALYLGTLEELDAYFEEELSEVIREKFPKAYEVMKTPDENGAPMRIIEVKRPGVIFNSLENSARVDSVSVLRPAKISKADKRTVVLNALPHFGKGYDFNFDFTTEKYLVCSELVYRSFIDAPNLHLELRKLNGRLIFSPNNFVKKFDDECEGESPELEFVLFLDGNEKTKKIIERTKEEFRKSWKRPKWHIVKDHL